MRAAVHTQAASMKPRSTIKPQIARHVRALKPHSLTSDLTQATVRGPRRTGAGKLLSAERVHRCSSSRGRVTGGKFGKRKKLTSSRVPGTSVEVYVRGLLGMQHYLGGGFCGSAQTPQCCLLLKLNRSHRLSNQGARRFNLTTYRATFDQVRIVVQTLPTLSTLAPKIRLSLKTFLVKIDARQASAGHFMIYPAELTGASGCARVVLFSGTSEAPQVSDLKGKSCTHRGVRCRSGACRRRITTNTARIYAFSLYSSERLCSSGSNPPKAKEIVVCTFSIRIGI